MLGMEYPRILVLSNNSFSQSNSNGRTLGSLLNGWPKDRIAQFCISSDGADLNICNNYFCVTDQDVVKSLFTLSPAKRRSLSNEHPVNANIRRGYVKHRKSSLKMLVRNIMWIIGIWQKGDFRQWLEAFSPEVILLQNSDSFFMHRLAVKLAKQAKAKLAIFNTEGYYLFNMSYFPADGFCGLILFRLYRKMYMRSFEKFMAHCSGQIYGNQQLKEDYDKIFGNKNSIVLYTSSNVTFEPKDIDAENVRFSYLGNLGYNRPSALIEFAEIISEINFKYRLDIYGPVKDSDMKNRLHSCKSINYHGQISYSEVQEVIKSSDFLIHVESQDEKWQESLRYGFSTKIADSIASGKVFVLYSSPKIACAKYINETGAGIFAESKECLKTALVRIIEDSTAKDSLIQTAKHIKEANHNIDINTRTCHMYLTTLPSII